MESVGNLAWYSYTSNDNNLSHCGYNFTVGIKLCNFSVFSPNWKDKNVVIKLHREHPPARFYEIEIYGYRIRHCKLCFPSNKILYLKHYGGISKPKPSQDCNILLKLYLNDPSMIYKELVQFIKIVKTSFDQPKLCFTDTLVESCSQLIVLAPDDCFTINNSKGLIHAVTYERKRGLVIY